MSADRYTYYIVCSLARYICSSSAYDCNSEQSAPASADKMREDSSERLTIGNSVKVVPAATNNNNGSPQHQQQLSAAIDDSSTEQQRNNNGCNGQQQQQQDETKKEASPEIIIKVYKRRWLMLSLYIFYAAIVAGQWIEYSIISNIIQRYYDVGGFAVDCTSMIFMLFYEIFIFPVTFLSERIGLRWSLVAGSALCCLGSWIKIFSVTRDGFYMTLFGQSIIAVSLVIMLILPGRVAAKWFASDELATATSLGIFGPQLGVSLSFLLPPIIVKNHVEVDDIGPDLAYMFWWIAGASTVSLVLMAMFFEEEPKLPPNATIAIQKSSQSQNKEGFMKPMKRLFTNKSFLILCNSYGINVGIFNALSTLLNPLFLMHFKNGEEDAGRIGLMIVLTGMFGSVTFGVILDRTHKFNFFMSGYLALGYELAAEYTYPESEAHSAGMLNIANNIYGIVLILILEIVLEHYSDVPVHVIFCSALFVGLIMTLVTKDEQRRQDARKSANVYQGLPIEDTPQVAGLDNARLQRQQSREDSKTTVFKRERLFGSMNRTIIISLMKRLSISAEVQRLKLGLELRQIQFQSRGRVDPDVSQLRLRHHERRLRHHHGRLRLSIDDHRQGTHQRGSHAGYANWLEYMGFFGRRQGSTTGSAVGAVSAVRRRRLVVARAELLGSRILEIPQWRGEKLATCGLPSISCLVAMSENGNAAKSDTSSKRILTKLEKFHHLVDTSKAQVKMLARKPYVTRLLTVGVIMFGMTSTYYSLMTWFPELFQRFAYFEANYPDEFASVCTVSKKMDVASNLTVNVGFPIVHYKKCILILLDSRLRKQKSCRCQETLFYRLPTKLRLKIRTQQQ
ncbi:unnamed protein product [Trichogramma brassicae]|uniref:Major facilitator superfamily (MFS) profile domain-containing protein n=1 Tax=Trichogramma brassicae TaxID=86971 RepID=A0A6H5IGD2_9HYME|nr:unnamed protein product [Trichogramma brassicae]